MECFRADAQRARCTHDPIRCEETGDVLQQHGGLSPHHGPSAHTGKAVLPAQAGQHTYHCSTGREYQHTCCQAKFVMLKSHTVKIQ